MSEDKNITYPIERTPADPPPGVLRYEDSVEGGQQKLKFGLESMSTGMVEFYGEGPQRVEGTYLKYQPGIVLVEVKRQDLTATEVNRLGELGRELYDTRNLISFRDKVDELTRRQVSSFRLLRSEMSETGLLESQEIENQRSEQHIARETGVSAEILRDKGTELGVKLSRLNDEAERMGVSSISIGLGAVFVSRPKTNRAPKTKA